MHKLYSIKAGGGRRELKLGALHKRGAAYERRHERGASRCRRAETHSERCYTRHNSITAYFASFEAGIRRDWIRLIRRSKHVLGIRRCNLQCIIFKCRGGHGKLKRRSAGPAKSRKCELQSIRLLNRLEVPA